MPEYWKIRREWRRLNEQFTAYLGTGKSRKKIAEYEARSTNFVAVTRGKQSLQENCAIILLFQPNGIPISVYKTCQYLRAQGLSVFAVSNSPLRKTDRDTLLSETSFVMERPNLGYDFGGYREAVLYLSSTSETYENVLLLNDSIWFPVLPDSRLLQDLFALPEDVSGPMMQVHRNSAEKDHLQSYMINFKGHLFQNKVFLDFWTNFRLPINRYQAIHSGEMILTNQLRKLGFSIGHLHSSVQIKEYVLQLSDDELRLVWPFIKWSNRRAARQSMRVDFTEKQWSETARELIERSFRNSSPLDTHPIILLEKMGLPYIKKDRNVPYQKQRAEILNRSYQDSLDPTMLSEIQSWD